MALLKAFLETILHKTYAFKGRWRVQRLWENLIDQNKPLTIELRPNLKIKLDMHIPYERKIYLLDEEIDDLLYLENKLKKGDVFIDIGANIGLWTMIAAHTVGSEGRVFSFEPNPSTFQKHIANVELNNMQQVIPSELAVSDIIGQVQFNCHEEHNVSSIVVNKNKTEAITVKTTCIDSFLKDRPDIKTVTGIKIDTEGHEFHTVQGMKNALSDYSPWVIVEFIPRIAGPCLKDWDTYHLMTQLGYSPYHYATPLKETPIDESFTIDGYTNILFKKSKQSKS